VILSGIGASVPMGPWNMAVLWLVMRGWGISREAATSGIAAYGVLNTLTRLATPLLAVVGLAISGTGTGNGGAAVIITVIATAALVLACGLIVAIVVALGSTSALRYIGAEVGLGEFAHAAWLGAITLARVTIVVILSTLIWVPVGVKIGMSPRLARYAQPIVQILASFPANFLFPFFAAFLVATGLSLNWGGIVLMMLGAQWYILFNAIAGAISVPSDLREAMDNFDVRGRQRWRRLNLPGIFPAYVTGGITAAGGAWNASIVAELVTYGHHVLIAKGLGAYIALSTASGQFAKTLTGIVVMSIYVVGINRLVWRRLYRIAETRYSL